jgi:hypothetical protein
VAHNSPSDCCNCHRRRHKKLEFEDTIDTCGTEGNIDFPVSGPTMKTQVD